MSGKAFKLNSADTDFVGRQKKVFDQLLVLENNRKNLSSNSDFQSQETRSDRRSQRRETKHFRGKESIFKKPQNPAPKNYINRIPDFKKNPHKWTRYSLEDVQDMTDESNTKSAMDFLKELAKRRKMEEGMEEEKLEELPDKIVFNKHVKVSATRGKPQSSSKDDACTVSSSDEAEHKASYNSSKLVMPEYVIGQKTFKKDRRNKKIKPEKGKELKLDHLTFDDE